MKKDKESIYENREQMIEQEDAIASQLHELWETKEYSALQVIQFLEKQKQYWQIRVLAEEIADDESLADFIIRGLVTNTIERNDICNDCKQNLLDTFRFTKVE